MMKPGQPRSGFTLVELLIVIALIGILAALVASATMRIVGTQEGKTTETNLLSVYDLLDQHWKEVIKKANSDVTIPDKAYEFAGKYENPPTPNWEKRARVIHVKMSLRQNFPVLVTELTMPPGYAPPPGYAAAASAGLTRETVSSALLYLALKQARGGASTDLDRVLPSNYLIATNHPDVKAIADGWGNPIVFSRWPYFDAELNPPTGVPQPFPQVIDPQDPNGLLSDAWTSTTQGAMYGNFMHPVGFQRSHKLQPVLMSWGPDKAHGLVVLGPPAGNKEFAALRVINQSEANDNIYSYRLRAGGSGN